MHDTMSLLLRVIMVKLLFHYWCLIKTGFNLMLLLNTWQIGVCMKLIYKIRGLLNFFPIEFCNNVLL